MIKLKQLLKETFIGDKWYPAHTQESLKWVLSQENVPIYPKTIEKLIGQVPVTAFHMTGPEYIPKVAGVVGKKKSLSTFDQVAGDSPLAKGKGIQTGSGGIIFQVEGFLLARAQSDLASVPDKTGRRWLESRKVFGDSEFVRRAAKKNKKLYTRDEWYDMEQDIQDEIKDKNPDLRYMEVVELAKVEMNKKANELIRNYIDFTNDLLMKNKKKFVKNLTSDESKVNWNWNEIILHSAKIKSAFVMKRLEKDYYFKENKKQLEKLTRDITYGTPGQYRKWYTARKGQINVN